MGDLDLMQIWQAASEKESARTAKAQKAKELKEKIKVAQLAAPPPKLTVLSLGWGIQSTSLAIMAANGELHLDYAIFSDTTYELQATYKYAEKLTPWLEARGVKILTVCDIKAAHMPFNPGSSLHIPAFVVNKRGKEGRLRRQCTGRWKIQPMRRKISQILRERKINKTSGVVHQVLGISWDEASRASSSNVKYITNIFPLLDRRMTRQDCADYITMNGLHLPEKSACYHCTYHDKKAWQKLKEEGGEDWLKAVAFDKAIRGKSTTGLPLYIHRKRKPLEEAVIVEAEEPEEMFKDMPGCDSGGYCEFIPG